MQTIRTPFRFLIIVFVTCFLFVMEQAISNASGAPTGGTGAPGETNCTSCHTGTAAGNSTAIRVITNFTNGQYIPDSTYQIIIRAKKSSGVKFGFSATMLNSNASPTKLGTLQVPSGSSRVQLSTGTRDYMTHTTTGSSASYTDSTEWIINWKAPSTLSGDARLYIAALGANNDGLVTGDETYLKDYTFAQTTNVPVATITTNVNTSCTNDSVYFQGSGTNGTTSYQWTFPGGNPSTSTDQNVWVKFTVGTKVCSLRVANNIMYSAYATKSITVNNYPFNANISYNNSTLLCDGDSIVLTATFNASYTYQWQLNGTNISGATNVQYYAKQSGNYRAIITNAAGCNAITAPVTLSFNPSPNPVLQTLNNITTGCKGDTIVLITNSGPNYSYYWYRDNVLEAQTLDTFYKVSQTGDYKVKAFTAIGCSRESNTLNITFFNKPSGSIAAQADSICYGDIVKLNAFSPDTISYYQWYKDSVPITGANNQEYDVSTTGSYMVELVTNRGCSSTFPAKFIKVNPLPPANFIDTARNGCSYIIQVRYPGNYTYEWLRDGNLFNVNTPSVTVNQSGVYLCVITNVYGCKINTNAINITMPLPPANFIDSTRVGCTYVLKLRNPGNFNWQWQQDGITFNGKDTSVTVTQSGVYTMLITNNAGCSIYTNSFNLTIPALIPDATITPTSDAIICSDSSGVSYVVPLSPGMTYTWYKNGIPISGANQNSLTVKDSGSYYATVSNGFCTFNSAVRKVRVNPTPLVLISGNKEFCSGDSIILKAGNFSGTTYQWYLNNSPINGATDSNLVVKTGGNYQVRAAIGSCFKNSSSINVIVNTTPPVPVITRNVNVLTSSVATFYQWFKNASPISGATAQSYTVSTDGTYSVEVSSVSGCKSTSAPLSVLYNGINKPLALGGNIKVSPNPVTQYLKIEFPEKDLYQVELIDASGRIISDILCNDSKTLLDCSAMESGIYFVKVMNANYFEMIRVVKN